MKSYKLTVHKNIQGSQRLQFYTTFSSTRIPTKNKLQTWTKEYISRTPINILHIHT